MKLLVATGNPHKLEEFRRILEPLGIEALSPAQAGIGLDVEENGDTFAANARLKAEALRHRTGYGVVADDSGLCVDALGGRPGVYSARYMGENTPREKKLAGLLEELRETADPQRTARFVAAICCVLQDGTILECEGICEGHIGHMPTGSGGFGYDPIFMVGDRSFASLSPGEKDVLSHRGRALRGLAAQLKRYMNKNSDSEHEGGTYDYQ